MNASSVNWRNKIHDNITIIMITNVKSLQMDRLMTDKKRSEKLT